MAANTTIDFNEAVVTNAKVYYSIFRGTACATGTIHITGNNTAGYSLDEERTENSDVGVGISINATTGTVQYTTTNTGSAATLHYSIEQLK